MWQALIASLCLAASTLAVPTGFRVGNICSKSCESAGDFVFPPGQTYVYSYSADVETSISGASDEASRLHVTSSVELAALSPCDIQLKLLDVTLRDSDPTNAASQRDVKDVATFKHMLEQHSLIFSFQNGQVEHLCAQQEEPVWVLNIKRGVLSALVSSVSLTGQLYTKTEKDVSGECETDYIVEDTITGTLVTKTKNLMACRQRGHVISSLHSTPYQSSSRIQSLPLLASQLKCEQNVVDKRVRSVKCEERHQFRPFSRQHKGAVTITKINMVEQTVRNRVDVETYEGLETRQSSIFDPTDPELKLHNHVDMTMKLLDEMDQKTSAEVRPEAPRLFMRLVSTLRHMDYTHMCKVVQSIVNTNQKKYFIDALPMVGTAASMAVMRDMIHSQQVTAVQRDNWMTSLAFVHDPNLEMVKALVPLVSSLDASKQALLGVSSLVYHYCKQQQDCLLDQPVLNVVAALEQHISDGCNARSEEHVARIMTALKALGNVGRFVDSQNNIRRCLESTENTLDIRLAAINAFQRVPCNDKRREAPLDSFSSQNSNSEIRIAAYMSIMKCPSYKIINKIHEVLAKEPVNQVSSFVWTHLTNLQETNDPAKQHVKSLLSNINLEEKFKTDMRKFSRYMEKSLFFESLNTGASVESSVVFSPDSFIPRSGMLNLTLDLFGEAINLFEVGGRVEGLDDFAKNIFGDNGALPQVIGNLLRMINNDQTSNKVISTLPQASTYLKVFGNELKFDRFNQFTEMTNAIKTDGPLHFLQNIVKYADWTENIHFLDSAYTVPTISGLPFSLRARGSASVSLKTGGSYDIQSWKKININGFIKPSAAVEIFAEMGVDAHVAHTSINMNTNLHTSTVVDGKVLVDGGKIVSVNINMPKDKIEVLDISTRFHSAHRNEMRRLNMLSEKEMSKFTSTMCSGAITERLFGINMCANLMYPIESSSGSHFLLSAPINAQLYVKKTDNIQAFKFEYQHSHEDHSCISTLLIDTPGSSIDRRISIDVRYNAEEQALQMNLHTPIKSVDLSGIVKLDGPIKFLDAQVSVDEQEVFGIVTKLETETTDQIWRIAPSFVLRRKFSEFLNLQADFTTSLHTINYNANFVLSKLFERSVTLKSLFYEENGTYKLVNAFSSYIATGEQTSTLEISENSVLVHTNTEYRLFDRATETFTVAATLAQQVDHTQYSYKVAINTESSAIPWLNCEMLYIHNGRPGSCDNRLTLLRGNNSYVMMSHFNSAANKLDTTLAFTARHWNIDVRLGAKIDVSRTGVTKFSGETQLNSNWKAGTKVVIHHKSTSRGFHYGTSVDLMLPGSTHQLEVGARHDDTAAHLKLLLARDLAGVVDKIHLVTLFSLDEEDKAMELTLSLPHLPRIQLLGRLATDEDTSGREARLVAHYDTQRYEAGVQYTALLNGALVTATLQLPERKIHARAEANFHQLQHDYSLHVDFGQKFLATAVVKPFGNTAYAELQVFLNKDVDDSERIKFMAESRRAGQEINSVLEYPGRRVALHGKIRVDGVAVSLEFSPNKIVTVNANWLLYGAMGVECSVEITTPLPELRTLQLTFTNSQQQTVHTEKQLINFKLVGGWNDKNCELTGRVISGAQKDNQQSIQAVVNFNSSFRGWEKVHFDTTVFTEGDTYSARAAASLNEYSAGLGIMHKFSNKNGLFKLSSGMDIMLPIRDLKSVKLGVDCKMDQFHIDGGVLAIWKTDIANEFSISLSSNNDIPYSINHESKIIVKTPFKNHREYSTHLLIKHHADDYVYTLSASSESSNVFLVRLNAMLSNPNDININGHFQSFSYSDVSFDLRLTESSDTSKLTLLTKNGNNKMSFSGQKISSSPLKEQIEVVLMLPSKVTYTFKREYELDPILNKVLGHTLWSRDNDVVSLNFIGKWSHELDQTTGNLKWLTMNTTGQLVTPFKDWETMQVTQFGSISFGSEIAYTNHIKLFVEHNWFELVDKLFAKNKANWEFTRQLTTNTQLFSDALLVARLRAEDFRNIDLSADYKWDDNEMTAVYSHNLTGQVNNERVVIKTNVQISETTFYALDIDYTLLPNKVLPFSVAFTCPCGKTLITGSFLTEFITGESQIIIESPFTQKIIMSEYTNYNNGINYVFNFEHGGKLYSLNAKGSGSMKSNAYLDVGFTSPEDTAGNGSLKARYNLDKLFSADGELSLNNWKASAKAQFTQHEGQLNAQLPCEGYRTLDAAFKITDESVEILLSREDQKTAVIASRKTNAQIDGFNVRITTPYQGFKTVTISAYKEKNISKYAFDYTRDLSASVTIRASAERNIYNLKIEALCKLIGLVKTNMSIDLPKNTILMIVQQNNQELKLSSQLTKKESEAYFKLNFTNSIIGGPKKLIVSSNYKIYPDKCSASVDLIYDKDEYSGLINYFRTSSDKKRVYQTKLELARNDKKITVSTEYAYATNSHKLETIITTPCEHMRRVMFKQEINWDTYPVYLNMIYQRNDITKKVNLQFIKKHHHLQLIAETPYPKFKYMTLDSKLENINDQDTITTIFTLNQEQVTLLVNRRLNYLDSNLSFKLDSPYETFRHVKFDIRYNFMDRTKNAFISLVKNNERIQMNIAGEFSFTTARCTLTLYTPFNGWKNVIYNIMYDIDANEKIMEIRYEREGMRSVLASRGAVNEEAYIDILTPFIGYERLGLNGKYVNRRGKREVDYEAHMNDKRQRIYVLYERKEWDIIKLQLETPIEGMNKVSVDVTSQELSNGHKLQISTNRDGKKISAEIKITGANEAMDVSVDVSTYIQGLEKFTLTGNANYGGSKKSFKLSSAQSDQNMEISGELEVNKHTGKGRVITKLPIDGLRNADISFDYNIGTDKTVNLVSIRDGVTREFTGKLTHSDTSFTLDLTTPYEGFTKIHADAKIEKEDKIEVEINLKREDRKISLECEYVFSDSTGSVNIELSTPYADYEELEFYSEYETKSNSRSMKVVAKRNARKWEVSTNRSWESGKDKMTAILLSPIDEIQSVKIKSEADYSNLEEIKYDGSYEHNDKKVTLSARGSIKQSGSKVDMEVTATAPFDIKTMQAKVKYDFTSESKTLDARISVGERYADIKVEASQFKGMIRIETTNKTISQINFDYTANMNRHKRDIIAKIELPGVWKMSLEYNGDYSETTGGSGSIKIQCSEYGDHLLTWNYTVPNKDIGIAVKYNSKDMNFDVTLSLKGQPYKQRSLTFESTVVSKVYTSKRKATFQYDITKGVLLSTDIDSNGRKINGRFNIKKQGNKRIMTMSYNGLLLKDIKVNGEWTIPRTLEGQKDFKFSMTREGHDTTFAGFVKFGTTIKSGSMELSLKTPLKQLTTVKVVNNWNFIKPTVLFNVDYTRNDKHFLFNLSGSRSNGKADYNIQVNLPHTTILHNKNINQFAMKLTYDVVQGVSTTVSIEKPLHLTINFSMKKTGDVSQFDVVYDMLDSEQDIIPWADERHLELHAKHTERSEGSLIEINAKTDYQGYEKLELSIDVKKKPKNIVTVDYRRGDEIYTVKGELDGTKAGGNAEFSVSFPGSEEISINGKFERKQPSELSGDVEYKHGSKYAKFHGYFKLLTVGARSNPDRFTLSSDVKLETNIKLDVLASLTLDINGSARPDRNLKINAEGTFNGKNAKLIHTSSIIGTVLEENTEIVTPSPYKNLKFHSKVQLKEQTATYSFKHGKKEIAFDLVWYTGQTRKYGFELSGNTPFVNFKSIQIDVTGTLQEDGSVDVMAHYRRVSTMINVTANIKPYELNMNVESPWGKYQIDGGFLFSKIDKLYSVRALVTLNSGDKIGGEVTVKATAENNMQFTIDIQTPVKHWSRINADVAYTNTNDSHLIRLAFESPFTKRAEVGLELTNRNTADHTDFKARVKTEYMDHAFTLLTVVQTDGVGTKYEFQIDWPFHLLPSFKITGRR